MFAIAFDLRLNETAAHHPVGLRQAYRDMEGVLHRHGFRRAQQSLFITDSADFSGVFWVISELKALPWTRDCIKDIRAFRVENWSDFTGFIQAP